MSTDSGGDRKSRGEVVEVPTDEDQIAHLEARNALRQFDVLVSQVNLGLDRERPFRLRPSIILHLNRAAIEGLSVYPGVWRPGPVEITGSSHEPPPAHLVPSLAEELCDYVNENWDEQTAVHLAAYTMWRLNWIHPFVDGNGRTSRALSYLVLCVRSGFQLPGRNTIPEQIAQNKNPYYEALEAADASWEKGEINLTSLEEILGRSLAVQLVEAYQHATGSMGDPGVAAAPK